ncbi:MAG TPA: hypothetical protein DCY40_09895 [Actinobacteria bacterium]|nr:hypothetical protein [Actinomycetota bacterium]
MTRGIRTDLALTVVAFALLAAGCGRAPGSSDAVPTVPTTTSVVTTVPMVAPGKPVDTTTTSTTTTSSSTTTSAPVPLPDIDEALVEFDDLESLLDELEGFLADL